MRIRDLQGEDCILISDSQDIKATMTDIGREDEVEGYGCLLVILDDSGCDYASVYGCFSNIPYLDAIVDLLY